MGVIFKRVAMALAAVLLAGCTPSAERDDPSQSESAPASQALRFTTVLALRDALIQAGYECQNWRQSDDIASALQSGSCSTEDSLSIYLDSGAVQSRMEDLKGADKPVTLTVGDNWIVETPRAESVAQMIGGTVVTWKPTTRPSAKVAATPLPSEPVTSTAPSTPTMATTHTTAVAPKRVDSRPNVKEATLRVGETAHLANWDVTVLRAEPGKDGISYGWKVNVCYVTPSGLAEDGRINVSDRPWSALVQDLEGGSNPVVAVPIREFERDHAYRPDYLDTTLSLGECNLGWIGIVHHNPDLSWPGIVYEPSTGEHITWLG